MPLVPLFNDGQTVKQVTPAAAPQGQLLRVVMQSTQAARAFATPNLPYQLADRSGTAALGQALGQVSQVAGAVALKKAEAINIRRVAEADNAMAQQVAEFENWKLQNPDETTWEAEWQERLAGMSESLYAEGLSPVAREEIQNRFTQFQGQSAIRLSTDVARTAFRKAGETLEGQALMAFENGDTAAGENYVRIGVQKGYIAGDMGARLTIAGRAKAKSLALDDLSNGVSAALSNPNRAEGIATAKLLIEESGDLLRPAEKAAKMAGIDAVHSANLQKDQIQESILTDPKKAIADLEGNTAYPLVLGGDRAALAAQAKQAQAAMASDAFRDVKTRIELGQVKADETFTGPGMEQLTPLMVDVLKAVNTDKKRLTSMNNPEAFQKAATAIDSYAPTEGDDLARANFEAYLESAFSGPHLESLKKQWDARMQTGADKVGTAEAFSALDRWAFDEQQMGQFKVPETDKDGRQLLKKSMSYVTQPGWLWGENQVESETYSPQWKDDPVKRNKVSQEVGRIKDLIRAEIKAGKLTDSAAVFRRMAELSKMPMATSAAAEAATAVEGGPSVVPPLNRPPPEDLDQKRQEALKLINPSATR